ncbi:beta-crystallin A2 isoform X1 [Pogona vitticeps]|uniref:Beta-crystallin A2 n=1 Tax=Pogona vitticeps TaxID=103695 RepID=A0ABM5F7M4_9SAUR
MDSVQAGPEPLLLPQRPRLTQHNLCVPICWTLGRARLYKAVGTPQPSTTTLASVPCQPTEKLSMTSQHMETLGQFKITAWEEENFQGKRCEFLMECPSIMERGFRKIRSIKVETGPWVGYEYPEYQGQQFILEKGDYPRWEAWSGNSGYRTEHLLSFRPIKCANHSDSKVTLYEGENFQGRKFELTDDYPSLQAMGWGNKEVASIKVNAGAWVAYQYPGYRGYQYVLERDRQNGEYKKYSEYSTQAHTNQIQSIRRVQH